MLGLKFSDSRMASMTRIYQTIFLILFVVSCFAPLSSYANVKGGKFVLVGKTNFDYGVHDEYGGIGPDFQTIKLNNGKVLLLGALHAKGSPQCAELYNPQSRQFELTGESLTNVSLADAKAVPLQNGKVLLIEQYQAEIYEPVTNSFRKTGHLNLHRIGWEASLLNDGKVLISGGFLPFAVRDHLRNNKIRQEDLVKVPSHDDKKLESITIEPSKSSGLPLEQQILKLRAEKKESLHAAVKTIGIEVFDPETGQFTWLPEYEQPVLEHALEEKVSVNSPSRASSVQLKDGRILITGGEIYKKPLWFFGLEQLDKPAPDAIAAAAIFVPQSQSLTPITPLKKARMSHKSVLLDDGTVLIVGGAQSYSFERQAELFIPDPD